MTNTNITNFRKDIYKLLGNTIIETLYISSMPKLKEEIIKRKKSPDEDFVKEDEVD